MKRTRLKPISDKRRAQMRQYSTLRRKFLSQHPVCEICESARSWEIHHRGGRTGKRLLEVEEWLALCSRCHADVHAHGAKARVNGFMK